jgi:hypothetical protein
MITEIYDFLYVLFQLIVEFDHHREVITGMASILHSISVTHGTKVSQTNYSKERLGIILSLKNYLRSSLSRRHHLTIE